MFKPVKYFLFLLALVRVPVTVYAGKTDSLLLLLKSDPPDTARVNHLNSLASILRFTNPDTSILLAQQAVALAHKINFQEGEATALSAVGIGYYTKGDFANALENYFKALDIDKAMGNKKGLVKRLGNIGIV